MILLYLDILIFFDIFSKMFDIYDIFISYGKQRNHNAPFFGKYVFLFFQLQKEWHPIMRKKWRPVRYEETATDSSFENQHEHFNLFYKTCIVIIW